MLQKLFLGADLLPSVVQNYNHFQIVVVTIQGLLDLSLSLPDDEPSSLVT